METFFGKLKSTDEDFVLVKMKHIKSHTTQAVYLIMPRAQAVRPRPGLYELTVVEGTLPVGALESAVPTSRKSAIWMGEVVSDNGLIFTKGKWIDASFIIDGLDRPPVYDEKALDRFSEEGAKAWANVPDAVAWVREIRGQNG